MPSLYLLAILMCLALIWAGIFYAAHAPRGLRSAADVVIEGLLLVVLGALGVIGCALVSLLRLLYA